MPIQYSIDPANNLVVSSFTTPVTCQDMLQFCQELSFDLRFNPGLNQIQEIQKDALQEMQFSDFEYLRNFDPFSPEARRAVLVHSDADYGMARMYATLRGGNLKVFRSSLGATTFLMSGIAED